jgi:preprotein translocase subunit YajC
MISLFGTITDLMLAPPVGAPVAQGPTSFMENYGHLVMLFMMFGVIYFLLIRPANKQRQEHGEMLNRLKKNDEVVTNGGLCGKVVQIDEQIAVLEIADKVRVKVMRDQIRTRSMAINEATKK